MEVISIQDGPPSDVCWFINHEITPMNTIVISTINHSEANTQDIMGIINQQT